MVQAKGTEMSESLNNSSGFNLSEVLKNQYEYLKRSYTANENGEQAMLNRELENAQKAIEGEGFLGLTLKQKIEEMMPSELMREEFLKVTIDTLSAAVQPFMDYLEKNELAFDPDKYQETLNPYAKQLFYAHRALEAESQKNASGQKFSASF